MAVNTGHDCNKGKIMRLCEKNIVDQMFVKLSSNYVKNVLFAIIYVKLEVILMFYDTV